MDEWKSRLADVDDDYLIGLSNKGIVKRAYKDKEEAAGVIESVGEEAVVKVGEETVSVRFPLGESKCSCPSRSMCRHVVHAILVLRERCLTGEDSASRQTEDTAESGLPMQAAAPASESMQNQEALEVSAKVRREIEEYPLAALKKAMGNRQLQNLASQASQGLKPKIQYASVVTVQLFEQMGHGSVVVKLLSPLEYSSCTCHKKELCAHKAAAILWCQLDTGALTQEQLAGEAVEEQPFDMEEVRKAAKQMKAFLEELFSTGLSRTSPDVLDYLERLAIISHNVGLAKFEGYFRALFDSYNSYFKRKAAFKTGELMEQQARLYRRVDLLSKAEDSAEAAKYAGEFKADYLPVGNLDLIGITAEHFRSQSGYEGETIYFLEENTREWYTYTNARPVYYDSKRGRNYMENGGAMKSPAPWGLNISLEDLPKVRLRLTGAKCDGRRRLSSSQETRGEVAGEQRIGISDVEGWYYRDFDKLFLEQIGKQQKEWLVGAGGAQEGAELVFVQPDSCAKAEFSQTGQMLSIPLYDKAGREIMVEMPYSKRESGTIRYLERISEKKCPCFLGKVYLRDGRVRMYPVDVLDIV